MNWVVYMAGEAKIFGELSEVFKRIDGYEINKDDHGFFLTSNEFESLNDAGEIKKRAEILFNRINSSLKLLGGGFTSLSVSSIDQIRPDGSRIMGMFLQEGIAFSASARNSIIKSDGTAIDEDISTFDHDVLRKTIIVAPMDPAVEEVLNRLKQQPLDWVNLFRIYEIIKKDAGKMILKWATQGEIKNFSHTAQSPEAIGSQARHGIETSTPPTNPMSFDKAKDLIGTIYKGWINSKHNS